MKKTTALIIAMMFIFAGCENATNTGENIETDTDVVTEVEIIANNDSSEPNGMPITLTAKITGEQGQDLQYHWVIENNEDYEDIEGFVILESGPQKEMTNSGEPVELGLFAQVMWVAGTSIEFDVQLQVKEKGSSNVIATDDITIVNNEGIYSIKQ